MSTTAFCYVFFFLRISMQRRVGLGSMSVNMDMVIGTAKTHPRINIATCRVVGKGGASHTARKNLWLCWEALAIGLKRIFGYPTGHGFSVMLWWVLPSSAERHPCGARFQLHSI